MKWIVYMHILNEKPYIGYTSKGAARRLEQHVKDAQNGSERHFCRAIRKYGAENVVTTILAESDDLLEIKQIERAMIKQFDSVKNGYNCTLGGDGGNTTLKFSPNRKRQLAKVRSKLYSGTSNPNSKGKTVSEILEFVLDFLVNNDLNWVKSKYQIYAKEHGFPENLGNSVLQKEAKERGKKWQDLVVEHAQKIGIDLREVRYRPTKEHIQNNPSVRQKGGKWFYNETTKTNKYFNPSELESVTSDWKPGRKLEWH